MTNREWFTALCVLMHESEGVAGERLRDPKVEAEIGDADVMSRDLLIAIAGLALERA